MRRRTSNGVPRCSIPIHATSVGTVAGRKNERSNTRRVAVCSRPVEVILQYLRHATGQSLAGLDMQEFVRPVCI